jgi:hypothetical protein
MITRPRDLSWQLLTDKRIYEARNEIQQQVMLILGESHEHLKDLVEGLPESVLKSGPKISRGENYNGKPWMVLDFPRDFSKDGVFAFRVLFLFGDAVHCTFLLSGKYLEQYRTSIIATSSKEELKDLAVCYEGDMWVNHVTDAYEPFNRCKENLANCEFIKAGKKIPFEEWEKIPTLTNEFFKQIIKWIKY